MTATSFTPGTSSGGDVSRSNRLWTRLEFIPLYPAAAALILHLIAISRFGYFRDELYYLACSDHLAFGFVDQPPLSALLLKGVRLLLGDSLPAIRLLPILAGVVFIYLTGRLALELGGKHFAVLLSSCAALAQLGTRFSFHVFSMNGFDMLFWTVLILIVVRILRTENPKLWIVFGLCAGIGLQNKISILFLGLGLVVGMMLTGQRKQFRVRELWWGGLTAGLIFLPYVIWNAAHDGATLEFMRNARAFKMSAVSPGDFFLGQLLFNNPAAAPIWLAGLGFLFFHRDGRRFRIFGWMYLTIYLLFTLTQAKDYYLAGAYPVLFAAGAVGFGKFASRPGFRWARPVLVLGILIPGLLLIPIALPILSVERTIAFTDWTGISRGSGERHEQGPLPQHFADMHGWEEMAALFGRAYQCLTPEERADCMIFTRNYGEAGAIDFFGRRLGLPPASSGHNNYWIWGPPEDYRGTAAIIIGDSHDIAASRRDLENYFQEVELAGIFRCRYCMPYENGSPVFICRGARGSMRDVWPEQKHFN